MTKEKDVPGMYISVVQWKDVGLEFLLLNSTSGSALTSYMARSHHIAASIFSSKIEVDLRSLKISFHSNKDYDSNSTAFS